MFTGLVTDVGEIVVRQPAGGGINFGIATDLETDDFGIGESIAIDGACLTVTAVDGDVFRVDAAPETLKKTTLEERQTGDRVHLERALRLGDRLGGHFVQGHVDAVGEVVERRPDGSAFELVVEAPPAVARLLIEKGSVAVDGVSLTAYDIGRSTFTVTIVPHTARETNLGSYQPGRAVNLEADMLGKYVARLVDEDGPREPQPPSSSRH